MKEMILGLLLIVALSSFVIAGSEIGMSFVVGEIGIGSDDYIPEGFCNNYTGYIVGVLVILVIFYIVSKMKNGKIHKRKKISKGKARKKK